jgi:hypothetical protein
MKATLPLVMSVLCFVVQLAAARAQAAGALDVVPQDALAFAVIHDLADASAVVDDVATLVQAPAPDLLAKVQQAIGLQKGIDDHGDVVVVLTSVDPTPKYLILTPVADFAEFYSAFDVTEPSNGAVEVQLAGTPTLVGRKGGYAAMAPTSQREALERYIADETHLASDDSLAAWLDANQASVVLTARGAKTLFPKLIDGIRVAQAGLLAAGPNGKTASDALNMYIAAFTAAQAEVEQLALGLRIDSARTVALVKRVQFVPGGSWATAVADVKAADGDPLAGLPAGPFIVAGGGVFPGKALDRLMTFSVEMMKSSPGFNLTPEQARKYVELSTKTMAGARSMAMVLGVPQPGTGLYGNTTAVMTFDDAQRFLDEYEKTLAAMSELAEETKSPAIPKATSQRTTIGDVEALEITMEMPNLAAAAPAGGPDMQKMMQLMAGPDGQLKIYLAAADEHAVVMAYTSPDVLTKALAVYKSQEAGLSGDAQLAQTAAALPPDAQFVAYIDLSGMASVIGQFAETLSEQPAPAIPKFAEAPPIGMAAKLAPRGVEGSLVIPAETLRAIGDAVNQARNASAPQ